MFGLAWHWWLKPVILVMQEGEIRRIIVLSQPRQIVCNILSQTNKQTNKKSIKQRAGGVAQVIGSEFKPQYHRKKNV
jgi:hypothetical protein